MIDISKLHLGTVKAVKNHNIDYTMFETVEALRFEIARLRKLKSSEKWRDTIRKKMVERYRENPEYYRELRKKTRNEAKERDPEAYAKKNREYSRNRYAKIKAEKLKQLEKPQEEFKLLELND